MNKIAKVRFSKGGGETTLDIPILEDKPEEFQIHKFIGLGVEYKVLSYEIMDDQDEDVVADIPPYESSFACDKCEFIGKSNHGLKIHKSRSHNKN